MRFLFDASSMLEVIKTFDEEKAIRTLSENCILDLTKYEVGNALWREHVLQRTVTKDQFHEFVTLIEAIMLRSRILAVEPERLSSVATIAASEKITFYDASYITVAEAHKLILITEDHRLARAASKHVKTAACKQIKAM